MEKPTRVRPSDLSVAFYKKKYGGSFPNIKSTRYPPPDDEKAWMALIAEALTHQNKRRFNHHHKLPPVKADSRYSYILHHCTASEKKRRAKRNKHRKIIQQVTGQSLKGLHVHHTNSKTLSLGSTIVLKDGKHLKMHGAQWSAEIKKKKLKKKCGFKGKD